MYNFLTCSKLGGSFCARSLLSNSPVQFSRDPITFATPFVNSKPGAPGENRTPDALLRTEALYPLSYGGSFPLRLEGAGCIGAVTISGLPERMDHNYVVEVLASCCGVALQDVALDNV